VNTLEDKYGYAEWHFIEIAYVIKDIMNQFANKIALNMTNNELIIQERIAKAIYLIRKQKVMMDSELAEMYGVETKVLNQAVKRNIDRFPEDFMFQLTNEEWENLKSQFVTSSETNSLRSQIVTIKKGNSLRSQTVTLEKGRGKHRKYLPYAFTEQGVAMLSSVVNSPVAIHVNISIMRVFVNMRQWATNYEDLLRKIGELSLSQSEHSQHIRNIYKIIEELVRPAITERKPIGYKTKANE
jgi:predicted XRE-type DNA-binding protein